MNSLEFGWMFSHRFLYLGDKNGGVIKGLGGALMVADR